MPELASLGSGRVWKIGDSISTNQIGGGRRGTAGEELRANCLRSVRPEFADEVKQGDILVAGANFGNGSSSPGAVEALIACGLQAVLADSLSRLMLRTCIAKGLPAFAAQGISEIVEDGEELEIDYPAGAARNAASGRSVSLKRFPPAVEQIYEVGGIQQVIAKRLAEEGIRPPPVSAGA
jgi:3-isopropylmalate/(R)-2-methylmalate dehydratase small subunit